ncbi:MFS general substrate transporter [Martensiomyces pterosporus]|nr:MFS general substrate transporter [Martensiomyces pterosporus]
MENWNADFSHLPYSPFSELKKATIVVIIAISAIISPLAANMYYPAIQQTREDLHTTMSGINATMSVFTFGQAVFPLVWSAVADNYGRRIVYLASLAVYIAGSAGCAVSQNLAGMIVCRIVQACGASAVQGAGAGTIADIYERERRGTALGLYYLGPLLGTSLAPLVGGYSAQTLGFRWIFWILTIFGGVMFIVTFLGLPETHRRIVAEKHDIQPINIPTKHSFKDGGNPLSVVVYLRYPNIAIVCFQLAMIFGMMFGVASVNPIAYENIYGLSQGTTGLCYLGMGCGNIVGAFTGGRITDWQIRREKKRLANKRPAEESCGENDCAQIRGGMEIRLQTTWIGGILFLVGVYTMGWFIQARLCLVAIIIVQFLIGMGTSFQFNQMSSYFIDLFPTSAASITSVQNFVRGVWAGVCIEILPTMINNIGWGPTFTTFGSFALLGSILVHVVAIKGDCLRRQFNFSA